MRDRRRTPKAYEGATLFLLCSTALLLGLPCRAEAQSNGARPLKRLEQVVSGKGTGPLAASSHHLLPTVEDFFGAAASSASDVWSTDPVLSLADRLMSGQQLEVMREMVGLEDLDKLWANPKAAYRMLQGFPMFRVLSGVGPIADKAEGDLTPQDGLSVLSALRRLAERGVEHMEGLADQTGLARLMQEYATSSDAGLRDLYRRVEAGEEGAADALHDRVFQDLWGGVIEQQEMGTSTSEPAATALLRRQVMEEDPQLWDLITQGGDPMLKQILEDPTSPAKAALDLTRTLQQQR